MKKSSEVPHIMDLNDANAGDIIQGIIKYRNIKNAWKHKAIHILNKRFNLGMSTDHKNINETLDILRKNFPEEFL